MAIALSTFWPKTIKGLCKAEVSHRRDRWRSFEAVGHVTLEWINYISNRRLLEPIGNIRLAEAEDRHYVGLDDTPMAALFDETDLRQSRGGSTGLALNFQGETRIEQLGHLMTADLASIF
jgi:hypothetical protein